MEIAKYHRSLNVPLYGTSFLFASGGIWQSPLICVKKYSARVSPESVSSGTSIFESEPCAVRLWEAFRQFARPPWSEYHLACRNTFVFVSSHGRYWTDPAKNCTMFPYTERCSIQ
jgi:hypothetical protein